MPLLQQIDLTIAGVSLRIDTPIPLAVPREMEPFLTLGRNAQVLYEVQFITTPIVIGGDLVHDTPRQKTYRTAGGWLRTYPYLEAEDGCCAALLLGPDRRHTLYLPASDLHRYQTGNSLSPILGLDYVLMQENCFLLHSSVVAYNGYSLLFSGPSGIGKSTQADLWRAHLGAEILNGDRCCISYREGQFIGCGSPYAGSSNIYTPGEAPIQAIFLLRQGDENSVVRATGRQAFVSIYSQCLTNNWDTVYTDRLCRLLDELIENIPIYVLTCLPNESAVDLARITAFPAKHD